MGSTSPGRSTPARARVITTISEEGGAIAAFLPNSIEKGGGDAALSSFREVWLVDFEFQAPDGERPRPVCMVARGLRSGRVLRLWRDELLDLRRPPFDIGP